MEITKQILVNARKLIENEENWLKDSYARGADDIWRESNSPEAIRFCAIGSICNAVGRRVSDELHQAISSFMYEFLPDKRFSIGDYNDDSCTTHADILALFDRAIASFDEPEFDIDTWIDEFKKTLPEITDKRVLVKKNG